MMINNYDQPPYFKCDESLYPNREQQLSFMKSYLGEKDLTKENEEKLLREINIYALASHLFWALWSVCHVPSSDEFSSLVL